MEVVLKGYREWTESLGDDREWIIQSVQARIEKVASEEVAKCGGFYLPGRKDVLIFLLNNVPFDCIKKALEELEKISPVSLQVNMGFGRTPLEALRSKRVLRGQEAPIAAVHLDIDSFTARERYLGYVKVMEVYSNILSMSLGFGGLCAYLGGDNILVFLDTKYHNSFSETVFQLYPNMKIGVGIGRTPREAVTKAASSLSFLRRDRGKRIHITP